MRIPEWVRCGRQMGVVLGLLAIAGAAQAQAGTPATPLQPAFPNGESSGLGRTIAALLAAPEVSSAHWGIAVTALDGTPLYGRNEAQLFRPASNAKLFTTSAAMAMLGPEATFTTSIYGKLDAATGIVNGDLTLRGGGDAAFGTDDLPYREPDEQRGREQDATPTQSLADLRAMVDALVARGVKRVTGNIVGDDTEFVWEPYPEGWSTEDLAWGYGAPVSALDLGDNEMRLTVTPGIVSPGLRPAEGTVQLQQNGTEYYKVNSHVKTERELPVPWLEVQRLPGTLGVEVYGEIAAGSWPEIEKISVDQPALYAADVLRSMLLAHGIAVDGHADAIHTTSADGRGFVSQVQVPEGDAESIARCTSVGPIDCMSTATSGEILATHVSAPLIEDIVYMLKVSQNLHAETLLHDIGRVIPYPSSTRLSAGIVGAWLIKPVGIDQNDFMFYDGSGLSTKDLVTPRATAELLAYDARQPWFAAWKAALPVGGVDGTLEHRFRDAPLKGHVFAKTGTLGETAALSGYVVCASGRTVIFSIFADAHLPDDPEVRETIDQVVAAIAAAE